MEPIIASYCGSQCENAELAVGCWAIRATANHLWLTAHRGWVVAGDLQAGEPVRTLDGQTATVAWVHTVPGQANYYNLTVADDHTYAVGDGQYVVHNSCTEYERQVREANRDTLPQSVDEHEGLADTHPDSIRGKGTPDETYIDAKEHPQGATNQQVFQLKRDVAHPSEGELYHTNRGTQLLRYAALYQDTFTPFEYWFKYEPAQEVIDTIERFGGKVVIFPGT